MRAAGVLEADTCCDCTGGRLAWQGGAVLLRWAWCGRAEPQEPGQERSPDATDAEALRPLEGCEHSEDIRSVGDSCLYYTKPLKHIQGKRGEFGA